MFLVGPQVHLTIDGDGYFRLAKDRQAVYTTDVVLTSVNGQLATADGAQLLPPVRVPASATSITIDLDGTVHADGKTVGHIVLVSFESTPTPYGNYFISRDRAHPGLPGEGLFGIVRLSNASKSTKATPQSSKSHFASDPVICINQLTEVSGDTISLGDVATIEADPATTDRLSRVNLGASPMIGSTRGLSTAYILARIRNEKIDDSKLSLTCPPGATVTAKSQSIDPSNILEAARAAARAELGIQTPLQSAAPIPPQKTRIGQLDFRATKVIAYGTNGANVTVETLLDGVRLGERVITLVPTIAAGQVRLGDPVRIRIIRNGATVEVDGKARNNATGGQSASAILNDSGTVITGTVVGLNLIEVRP